MTPAEAIGILRGAGASIDDRTIAALIGADALEFQAWLFAFGDRGYMRFVTLYESWPGAPGEDSFLDYARAEWEKERKG